VLHAEAVPLRVEAVPPRVEPVLLPAAPFLQIQSYYILAPCLCDSAPCRAMPALFIFVSRKAEMISQVSNHLYAKSQDASSKLTQRRPT